MRIYYNIVIWRLIQGWLLYITLQQFLFIHLPYTRYPTVAVLHVRFWVFQNGWPNAVWDLCRMRDFYRINQCTGPSNKCKFFKVQTPRYTLTTVKRNNWTKYLHPSFSTINNVFFYFGLCQNFRKSEEKKLQICFENLIRDFLLE